MGKELLSILPTKNGFSVPLNYSPSFFRNSLFNTKAFTLDSSTNSFSVLKQDLLFLNIVLERTNGFLVKQIFNLLNERSLPSEEIKICLKAPLFYQSIFRASPEIPLDNYNYLIPGIREEFSSFKTIPPTFPELSQRDYLNRPLTAMETPLVDITKQMEELLIVRGFVISNNLLVITQSFLKRADFFCKKKEAWLAHKENAISYKEYKEAITYRIDATADNDARGLLMLVNAKNNMPLLHSILQNKALKIAKEKYAPEHIKLYLTNDHLNTYDQWITLYHLNICDHSIKHLLTLKVITLMKNNIKRCIEDPDFLSQLSVRQRTYCYI